MPTFDLSSAERACLLRAVYSTLDHHTEAADEASQEAAGFRQMASDPTTRMQDYYREAAAGWEAQATTHQEEAAKLQALADRLSAAD